MVSRYTTLVPSLGLRIGPACEAGLRAGMRRECVPPHRRKKEGVKNHDFRLISLFILEMIKNTAEVTTEDQYELVCVYDLLIGVIPNDVE